VLGKIERLLGSESILSMGRTAPNPSVAAVLLGLSSVASDGVSLFSGGTEVAGKRHAEIVAFDAYDRSTLRFDRAILFVTLEPCSTTGRTPPCTDRILSYEEVDTVVIYCTDPLLHGSGIERLRAANKTVRIISENRNRSGRFHSRPFLAGFLSRTTRRVPRFHLKAALTRDGAIGIRGRRVKISGEEADRFSMGLRSVVDAVIVGPGTISSDLPALNLRMATSHLPFSCRRSSGSDLFTETLMENLLLKEELILRKRREFEPHRIFLLGNPFDRSESFFEKQRILAEETGRQARYLYFRSCANSWRDVPDALEIPDLSDPLFMPELSRFFSDAGVNEVLIEGGSGLFGAVREGLTEEDRIYLLQSDQKLSDLVSDEEPGDTVNIPQPMLDQPSLAVYELNDGDTLFVKAGRE